MPLIAGLDIGSRTVRLALVRTGLGLPDVVLLEERALTLGVTDATAREEEIASAIRELVAKLPPGVDAIHTSLPGDGVSARLVDIPVAASKKAGQILAFELEALLPFDLATAVFHFQPAPGAPRDKARYLAAAAPAARVEAHLARCRAADIDPRVLSAGALPLADLVPVPEKRGRARTRGPESAPILVIDVGHERTDLVGVVGARPVFVRTLSHGGADVTAAIAAAFRIPSDRAEAYKHAQATLRGPQTSAQGDDAGAARLHEVVRGGHDPLLRDLRQSVAALTAMTGLAPIAVALAGGGSRLDGLGDLVEAAVRLPVAPLEPPKLKSPIDVEKFPLFAKAIGLAIRAAHRAARIDLRRGSFAVQADARALRGRVVASVVLFSLVILAWGFSAVARYAVLQYEAERQTEDLQRITKELLGEEIGDFARAAAIAKGTGGLQDPMPELDAFAVLDILSKRIPEEIQHDIDELDIAPERAELRGLVDSLADVDRVYEVVSAEPCFPVVNRGKTTRNRSDGRQKYKIDVEIRCPSGDEDQQEEGGSGPTKRLGARSAGARGETD